MGRGFSEQSKHSAGLLAVFSAIILVHGVLRATSTISSNDFGANYPPGLLLSAGVSEIFFSMLSFIAAMMVYMGDKSLNLSGPAAVCSLVFGWYVFFVYAVGAQIYVLAKFPNSDETLERVCALIGAIVFCGTLYGGQAFFGLEMWHSLSGKGDRYDRQYIRKRAIYYYILYFLAGLTCLIVGAHVANETGVSGNLLDRESYDGEWVTAEGAPEGSPEGLPEGAPEGEAQPNTIPEGEGTPTGEGNPTGEGTPAAEGAPEGEGVAEGEGLPEGEGAAVGAQWEGAQPYFVVVPALNVTLGVLMLVYSGWGLTRCFRSNKVLANDSEKRIEIFHVLGFFIWVFMFIVITLVSPGMIGFPSAGGELSILVFAMGFDALYFDLRMSMDPLSSEEKSGSFSSMKSDKVSNDETTAPKNQITEV